MTEYAFDEGNPVGIKAILKAQNICGSTVRLPLVNVSQELQQNIDTFIKGY